MENYSWLAWNGSIQATTTIANPSQDRLGFDFKDRQLFSESVTL